MALSSPPSPEAACTATGDAENFCMSRPPAIDPKLFATLCDECDFDLFVSAEPAELLSVSVLESKVFQFSFFDELFKLLPAEVPARSELRDPSIHTFTTGAYVRGGVHGTRCNFDNFPATSAVLAIVLRCACPEATFTSIALLRNQSAHLHRDLNNALDSRNWAVPLSVFGSGGIWVAGLGDVECPQPLDDVPVGLGGVLSFEQGPVSFDSHQWHCTAPWTGDRKLLVGFTVKGFLDFPPSLVTRLSAGLFQLPPSATADVFEVHECHPYPVLLELCSGLGRLTAQARHHGARGSVAVDFTTARDASAVPLQLDLAHASSLVCEWLSSPFITCVHVAPPGDMSLELSESIAAIVQHAAAKDLVVSLELPTSDSFWASPAGAVVAQACPFSWQVHLCAFSGKCTATALCSNCDIFTSLSRPCSCTPVSVEQSLARVYTWAFAQSYFTCLRVSPVSQPASATARAATLSQPRASVFPSLVSEHQQVVVATGSFSLPITIMQRLKSPLQLPAEVRCRLRCLPEGSQLLRVSSVSANKGGSGVETAWGIPRVPEEFVKAALVAGHPCKNEFALPQALQHAIKVNAGSDSAELAKSRALFFRKWVARSKELEPEEAQLKATMPKHVASILAPKKLLLWREMLVDLGYPDLSVFDEVVQGFSLSGNTPVTSIFPPTFKPARRSCGDVESWAPELRSHVISRCRPQGEEDEVVHTKTLEERRKGWARGPVPLEELPVDSLVSRRFGLKQGPKTRLIDDLTMGGVNEMVTVHESPKPHGPDIVAGMLLTFMRAAPGVPLQGRAYDLRSAYRQLPVSLRSLRHSFVAHWNSHESRVEVDQLLALPFGASRSVYGFLRVVTSVWWIGCMALGLVWSVFFDDFVTASRQDDVRHTEAAATALFKLLGWEYDECDEKSTEFSNVFKALGVSFNLTATEHGRVMLSNTTSRIAELVQTISEILESNSLPRAAALRLRGRMQFCDSFLFGRASRLCLQAVTKHAYEGSGPSVPSDLWDALHRYRECLKVSRPHTVCAAHNDPYYLFTDACYEPCSAWCAGLGAVLFSSSGEFCAFFSFCLDQSGREALGEKHKKTIIFELEFLALVVALVHWKSWLANRPCVAYLDNNSTRDVAISGRGRNPVAKALASVLLALEDAGEVRCWYARVPSPSNVADLPSREQCDTMSVMGQTCRADDASSALKDCLELVKPSRA